MIISLETYNENEYVKLDTYIVFISTNNAQYIYFILTIFIL
jgi:hypothetical protein